MVMSGLMLDNSGEAEFSKRKRKEVLKLEINQTILAWMLITGSFFLELFFFVNVKI